VLHVCEIRDANDVVSVSHACSLRDRAWHHAADNAAGDTGYVEAEVESTVRDLPPHELPPESIWGRNYPAAGNEGLIVLPAQFTQLDYYQVDPLGHTHRLARTLAVEDVEHQIINGPRSAGVRTHLALRSMK
jgi:hypothetical protein